MNPRTVVHRNYDFSVLFAVPSAFAKEREIIPSDDWHTAPIGAATVSVRACRLDEHSDYGFLVEAMNTDRERGPTHKPTYGFLLADALADPAAFAQVFHELPPDWNFGGLIAIDLDSGVAFNTNSDLAETKQWQKILDLLTHRNSVEITFSRTDTAILVEKRDGDIIMQQLAWEVPDDWGPLGRLHYPLHRFLNGGFCVDRLRDALMGYEVLCRKIENHGYACVVQRLRGTA